MPDKSTLITLLGIIVASIGTALGTGWLDRWYQQKKKEGDRKFDNLREELHKEIGQADGTAGRLWARIDRLEAENQALREQIEQTRELRRTDLIKSHDEIDLLESRLLTMEIDKKRLESENESLKRRLTDTNN